MSQVKKVTIMYVCDFGLNVSQSPSGPLQL